MNPTSVPLFNSQTPSAPAGFQNAKWQTDGQTPVQQITVNVPNTGGVAVKTASYTLTASDCGMLLVYNSASAGTFTLPAAPPFAQWQVSIANIGTGALTVSPGSLTLDGASASLTLAQNQGIAVYTDALNYFTERGVGGSASTVTLQTNGVDNTLQSKLNLKAGSNVSLISDAAGGVTINATTGGGAGGSFVQLAAVNSTTTTISGGFPASVTAGNAILVVLYAGSSTTSISSVTDDHGNTYSLVASIYPSSTYCGQYVYLATNVVGGTTNVTANFSQLNHQMNMIIAEYAGVTSASAVEASVTQDDSGGTSPCVVGPLATTAADDLLIATLAVYSGIAVVSATGYTTRKQLAGVSDGNLQCFLADTNASAAGSYSASWSGSGSSDLSGRVSAGILIALKTGSGGSTAYYQTVEHDGTAVTQRAKLNIAAGANVTVTASDNGNDTTTLTIASSGGGASFAGPNFAWLFDDFMSNVVAGVLGWVSNGGGGLYFQNGAPDAANRPGNWNIQANSGSWEYLVLGPFNAARSCYLSSALGTTIISSSYAKAGGQARFGWFNNSGTTSVDGVYFCYDATANGNSNWWAYVVSGGTVTKTDTGIAAAAWCKLEIDTAGTSAIWKIDGTQVATGTVPSGELMTPGYMAYGTNSQQANLFMDWFAMQLNYSR